MRHRSIRYGQRYRYSNVGYGVLGQVLAKVAGAGYAQALRQRVFAPLGLDATRAAASAPARGIGVVVLSNCAASVDALGLSLLHAVATEGAGLPERTQRVDAPGA